MYGWAVVCLCGLATGTETNWELLSAVQRGNATVVQMLLSSGSFDTDHMRFSHGEGDEEDTMVHQAAELGHAQVLQLLLDAWPAGVQARGWLGTVPLHRAFRSVNSDVVAPLLLKQWPDGVKAVDSHGFLPLHYAVMTDNLKMTQLLLERWPGALKVAGKKTFDSGKGFDFLAGVPLHLAAYSGSLELVQLLVESWPGGLDVTVADIDGLTPLHVAADGNDLQVARWIFQRDPPASYTWELRYCEVLIELGCNSSAATSNSWKDAARDLRCSVVESLSRPTLQLWLDDCGGSPQWADVFGTLADRIEDPEAKDQHISDMGLIFTGF